MSGLEQALRELGGDITGTLEEVSVAVALVDRSGVIRWQNRAARGRYGNNTGRPVASAVVPGSGAELEAVLSEVLGRGEATDFTVTARLPDGRTETVDGCAVPVPGGGNIVGVFGLTKPRRAEGEAPGAAALPQLTKRQHDVLALLAEGKSTAEIAADLSISVTTVRNHVANVLTALGAHTRLQAVLAASEAGLV
jgi:DNA-binding NarL/FixJ family response regulator